MFLTRDMMFSTIILLAIVTIPAVYSLTELEYSNDKKIQESGLLLRTEDFVDSKKPNKLFSEKFEKKEIDCLIWSRKCTKQLYKIKETILKALDNDCGDCREEDKQLAGNAVATLLFKQPEIWKLFIKKYDTKDNFRKMYLY